MVSHQAVLNTTLATSDLANFRETKYLEHDCELFQLLRGSLGGIGLHYNSIES